MSKVRVWDRTSSYSGRQIGIAGVNTVYGTDHPITKVSYDPNEREDRLMVAAFAALRARLGSERAELINRMPKLTQSKHYQVKKHGELYTISRKGLIVPLHFSGNGDLLDLHNGPIRESILPVKDQALTEEDWKRFLWKEGVAVTGLVGALEEASIPARERLESFDYHVYHRSYKSPEGKTRLTALVLEEKYNPNNKFRIPTRTPGRFDRDCLRKAAEIAVMLRAGFVLTEEQIRSINNPGPNGYIEADKLGDQYHFEPHGTKVLTKDGTIDGHWAYRPNHLNPFTKILPIYENKGVEEIVPARRGRDRHGKHYIDSILPETIWQKFMLAQHEIHDSMLSRVSNPESEIITASSIDLDSIISEITDEDLGANDLKALQELIGPRES